MSDSREWTAARDEYTYQLVQSIMPPILEIFEGIYDKVKETQNEEYALVHFQLELQKIPHWNNISIERECKKIEPVLPLFLIKPTIFDIFFNFLFNRSFLDSNSFEALSCLYKNP